MTTPVRVSTYTRVASRHDRGELARRHRRLAAAVACWRDAVLVGQFSDEGPTPSLGRPVLVRLLDYARQRRFDVLIVDHLSRLAPGEEDAARVVAAFSGAGVTVRALHSDHRRLLTAVTAAAIVRLIGG